jgi:hypothetical protein
VRKREGDEERKCEKVGYYGNERTVDGSRGKKAVTSPKVGQPNFNRASKAEGNLERGRRKRTGETKK